ncbi:bifunctional (p)ppGpp synthetase/guanosine-3',5'-bis(diphosphate) 3'-pyrophosphohydrolase [Candidatus Woesearchaeota archaeon]|nr:bifunctional (p)ppGpp synthetase/guanosine-3',5'-bis(diphosphate) 3'-pyrophosphohydrolase [Candidatus Woesearchaeota archaeon]
MENLVNDAKELAYGVYKDRGNLSLIENTKDYLDLLKEYELDEDSLAAALLVNVASLDEIKSFGSEVLELVLGLREFDELALKAGKKNKEEKIRKMLIAATQDMRILLIKLLERLHGMRNLDLFNAVEKKRIGKDTILIYAPIAYRLGLSEIKWELEDLSFRSLNPDAYYFLKKNIGLKRKEREKIIDELKEVIGIEIKKNKIKYEISGRPKHFYSIHKKMINKKKKFEEIYDLFGIRIIVENSDDCYKILGIINGLFEQILERFKDFIVSPRGGLYQSLHNGYVYKDYHVEVQIRTKKMNDIAEEGIAAHWRYKGIGTDKKFNKQLNWLRQVLSIGTETDKTFLYHLKLDLFGDKIFCFTPKGHIIELDEGSIVVDFAYAVHTDIGDKCVAAKVNGKFVSLRYKLKTGDDVEILTSSSHNPSRDWLGFVKTSKAFEKIKQSLKLRYGISGRRREKLMYDDKVSKNFISVDGDYETILAGCCNPLPGDNIIGAISSFKKVIVHNQACRDIAKIRKSIGVYWLDNFDSVVKLNIFANDRLGIFAEILNSIAAIGINAISASANPAGEDVVECVLHINFNNLNDMKNSVSRILKISGVKRIRIE